jgi:hypothetical protein
MPTADTVAAARMATVIPDSAGRIMSSRLVSFGQALSTLPTYFDERPHDVLAR